MVGIGSAIGGALGIGASIFGNISASQAMRKVKNNLENQKTQNQNWYNRRYNEDATQRADAQRIMAIMNEKVRRRNQTAAGTQAVMGGTEESVAASKSANNEALAEAASQIAVNGERRKDAIESQFLQSRADLDNKLNGMEQTRAMAVAKSTEEVAKVAGQLGDLDYDKIYSK